jgi:hypothetical protein
MLRWCLFPPPRHAREVIDGSAFSVTVTVVEPTDLIRIIISLCVFSAAGWALWKLWSPERSDDAMPLPVAKRSQPKRRPKRRNSKEAVPAIHDPIEEQAMHGETPATTAISSELGPLAKALGNDENTKLSVPEYAGFQESIVELVADFGSVESTDVVASGASNDAPDDSPVASEPLATLFDPASIAADTQAWLEQDWFGLGQAESSQATPLDNDHVAAAAEVAAEVAVGTAGEFVDEAAVVTNQTPTHVASAANTAAPPISTETGSSWHEAASAAIPTGRESKKLERKEKALAAQAKARAAKQAKRGKKATRRAEKALTEAGMGHTDDQMAPFTALPVRPPTRREIRKAVKDAAREVKAERREAKRSEVEQRRAEKVSRKADREAAALAAERKLEPASTVGTPDQTPVDTTWIAAAAAAALDQTPTLPSPPAAPLAWEHAAVLSRTPASPPQSHVQGQVPVASSETLSSALQPAVMENSHRQLWEQAAADAPVAPAPKDIVADLWATQAPHVLTPPSAPVDPEALGLPEPLPPRSSSVLSEGP